MGTARPRVFRSLRVTSAVGGIIPFGGHRTRRDSTFLLRNRLYEAPPHLAGKTIEARFDPLDVAEVEVWFQAQLQATARPLDPVVNGRLLSAKPAAAPAAEPTGINFVELVSAKKDDGKGRGALYQTVDFYFSETRDRQAAKLFLRDGLRSYAAAIRELQCERRIVAWCRQRNG